MHSRGRPSSGRLYVNFFDAQDKARKSTKWLVVVYVVATLLIVAGITAVVGGAMYSMQGSGLEPNPTILLATAVAAILLIFGATAYKTARLSTGGGRVAVDMGGTLVSPNVADPLRRRLRNVVEEMAIASGVPVPEIYVLEEEEGINAFAAGFTTGDAAIAVTRGCLELLDRDELQGVIAHEFSHVLNGDMRLNIRMMGVLFGIMVVGMLGRLILRGSYYTGRRNREKGAAVIVIVGLGLTILGWIGVFAARLIKAAVSRQREFLADASAVQFTRQTDGIANALKKIGGYSGHSYITREDPEEVSHMLFAGGIARLTSMFATHPPLGDRIRALDPNFEESNYPTVELKSRNRAAASEQVAGFSADQHAVLTNIREGSVGDDLADAVGRPESQHVDFARKLRASIPASLYAAAHSPDDAILLALALSMSTDLAASKNQLTLVRDKIGAERGEIVQTLYDAVIAAGPAYKLPLLEIAFPALKNRPAPQLEFLMNLVETLVEIDGRVDISEYFYYQILKSHLLLSIDPSGARKSNRISKGQAQQAAVDLVSIVSTFAGKDPAAQQAAYNAGIAGFGGWQQKYTPSKTDHTIEILDRSLGALANLNSAGKQSMLKAVSEAITEDGKVTLREAELLRTVCAALQCPLPPLLADISIISTD